MLKSKPFKLKITYFFIVLIFFTFIIISYLYLNRTFPIKYAYPKPDESSNEIVTEESIDDNNDDGERLVSEIPPEETTNQSTPPDDSSNSQEQTIPDESPTDPEEEEPEPDDPEDPPPPPDPDSCPVSTQNCVPCTKDELYCRYLEGEETGFLGWACQNNNPGNIRYHQYRINIIVQMGGTPPCANRGGFMAFSDYQTGRSSVEAYIRGINAGLHSSYPECSSSCTLGYFFSKYAPNNPVNYTRIIVEKMGGSVTSETNLSWIVDNRLNDLLNAIQELEGWFTQ
jgi:hypothetical protein